MSEEQDNTQIRYLKSGELRFFKAGATLRMTLEGDRSLLQASVVRIFPLTKPGAFFSVRDGSGKETGVLESLEGLDPASAACVREELERRYMVSRLKKVNRARERFGIVEWDVETDRGACRFSTRDMRDNVIRLPGHQYVIVDVEGNRFEVTRLTDLDVRSQACLLRFL